MEQPARKGAAVSPGLKRGRFVRRRSVEWAASRPSPRHRARIHVYAVCWNDMAMLPYFLRHYRPLGARFFLFDDGSDDGSLGYLHAQPDVEISRFEHDGHSFELSAVRLYDHAWMRSRGEADWVVVCDVDEHLYHRDLVAYLDAARAAGVTAIPARGYQMVAPDFPRTEGRLCDAVHQGARWSNLDKLMLFDPEAIKATRYGPGRHHSRLRGRVVIPFRPEVRLLHYRYLGLDYILRRNRELGARMSPGDLARDFGHRYRWSEERVRADYEEFCARAQLAVG